MWNYSTSSADLFKHIIQGQYCTSDQVVDWTLAVLQDPALDAVAPDRRSIWAEDVFVFGHEMVSRAFSSLFYSCFLYKPCCRW
jgi:hypothetical protein